jgi:sugar/nucleoside kinase (ribokinase family)
LSGLADVPDAFTTRFELKYDDDLSSRSLRSKNRMPPIRSEDLPASLKAKIIHLAPIAGEITYEVAERLRSCTQVLSLDPQGLIRDFDVDGNVTLEQPKDQHILGLIDIFKSTPNEIQIITSLPTVDSAIKAVHNHGVSIVIVTLGAKGAMVSVEGTIHRVPAYEPQRLIDPTGAGDAFIGAFLAEYARGENCAWCSHVGSAAASLVVEGIGPTSFGDKDEIYRRAHTLYEKEIKE